MGTSIFSRKLDLIYLIYFVIHIPVMFLMDLQTIYPFLLPSNLLSHPNLSFLSTIKTFYITTYHDQFFVSPPLYFQLFIWLELLLHVPVSFWAVRALIGDSPRTPLVLLLYSFEVFLTTLVCMYEYTHWSIPFAQKVDLTTLYGPYLLLSIIMGIDMYTRLSSMISKGTATGKGKGKGRPKGTVNGVGNGNRAVKGNGKGDVKEDVTGSARKTRAKGGKGN